MSLKIGSPQQRASGRHDPRLVIRYDEQRLRAPRRPLRESSRPSDLSIDGQPSPETASPTASTLESGKKT